MTGRCEKIQEELLFFVEGELDPRAALEVEEHLESCAPCRERTQVMRDLNRVLSGLPRKPFQDDTFQEGSIAPLLIKTPRKTIPSGFREQVLDAIRREVSPLPSVRRGGMVRWIPSLAAAAVIIAMSVLGYHELGPRPSMEKQFNIRLTMDHGHYLHVLEPDHPDERGPVK